ncbi:MAG: response regulator [Clostridia bacterium]|nr:response regulator [Clostridia bacterium]
MDTNGKKRNSALVAIIGIIAVMLILVAGTVWMGQRARKASDDAVRTVSLLYLDELAGRREQVVADNLQRRINDMRTSLDLLTEEDLSDPEHLQAYQAKMKRLFTLQKFAFIDDNGLIYTSLGTQTDIDEYNMDYHSVNDAEIFIKNLENADKTVIIAMPVEQIPFNGEKLIVCFMEIDMKDMLAGVSMQAQEGNATFTNIYTKNGIALSNTVLGGLAVEDNLLDALSQAEYETGYSYEKVRADFENLNAGVASFVYKDIRETISYVPVEGTDWLLTYLIRESVISEQIGDISTQTVKQSIVMSALTVALMMVIFVFILALNRKNTKLLLAKETADTESRIKQQELEEKLNLQNQLLRQERQNETMIVLHDMLKSGPWFMDFDEKGEMINVIWSDTFRKMLGYTGKEDFPDELESWSNLLHEDDKERVLKEYNDTINDYSVQKIYDVEYRLLTKNQGWRWFHAIGKPSRRADGTPITYIGIFMDITQQKEMEQMLAEQQVALKTALDTAEQANKAKTVFLSNMSHEIRTPMNAIIGLDNIALNDPETPERTKGYLIKIGTAAEHLLNLINDILDMSRIESGRMAIKNEEFPFSKLLEYINTMISGQCQDKGLEYICHINGHIDDYYIGDNMKLRQVLINILGNAVKFTPQGGKVEFNVERTAQYDGRSTVSFKISDTGIGISKEFLPHIFDAFTQEDSSSTNKYGSSGLGMAITKNIVELMNGDIRVESEKGVGTTFTVTVTLMDVKEHTADSEYREIDLDDMVVLIIDDDPVACEHAKLVLEKSGIASETAVSGAEAIEMVKLRHARMEPYNLILVDWKMPEMDGVETTRKIREIVGNESAIIILTAYKWDDVLEDATNAGVDSFISKPLFAANVIEEFEGAVKRKGAVKNRKKKVRLEGRRVLLAEDVEINAEIMKMILQTHKIEVDLAENGRIAVEKFSERPAKYYDAILMDIRMPEMDGLEATRAIRKLDRSDAKTVPVIAMTANAFDEDVQRSLQAGMTAHLSKPVEPEKLFQVLEELIGEADRADS